MLQLNDKTDNGSQSYYVPQSQAKRGLIIIAVIILFLLFFGIYEAGVSNGESYLRGVAAEPFQHHEFEGHEFEAEYRHERYGQSQQSYMPPIIINNRND